MNLDNTDTMKLVSHRGQGTWIADVARRQMKVTVLMKKNHDIERWRRRC